MGGGANLKPFSGAENPHGPLAALRTCRPPRALLESAAAQQAARMTAMDAATSNAGDMIDRLTLYMNRVRQASITKELIEVVSGAAAIDVRRTRRSGSSSSTITLSCGRGCVA